IAGDGNARRERRGTVVKARRRNRFERLAADRLQLLRVDDVDHGRFTGDDDGFGDGADFQVGVDGGREGTAQLDPLTLDCAETRQAERDRVRAGPQILDVVLAAPIGDGGAYFLDERRAGGLDRDARQDRPGAVLDESVDGSLCESEGWSEDRGEHRKDESYGMTHWNPLSVSSACSVRRNTTAHARMRQRSSRYGNGLRQRRAVRGDTARSTS